MTVFCRACRRRRRASLRRFSQKWSPHLGGWVAMRFSSLSRTKPTEGSWLWSTTAAWYVQRSSFGTIWHTFGNIDAFCIQNAGGVLQEKNLFVAHKRLFAQITRVSGAECSDNRRCIMQVHRHPLSGSHHHYHSLSWSAPGMLSEFSIEYLSIIC